MARKNKSKGKRYTASEKARAMQLYKEHGPSVTSRRLGIPYETIRRWANDAGVIRDEVSPKDQTAKAHAVAAQRASQKWADIREREADAAGDAAQQARERILDVLVTDDAQMLRAAVNAYETLINKAEQLSGQATERIAIWAEQDIDRELKALIVELEDQKREELPASKRLPPGEEVIEVTEVLEVVEAE